MHGFCGLPVMFSFCLLFFLYTDPLLCMFHVKHFWKYFSFCGILRASFRKAGLNSLKGVQLINNMGKKISTDKVLHQILRGAVGMYLFNKGYAALATRNSKLELVDGHFYNWNGIKVFYRNKGEGKPLILIHDLHPTASGYEWNYVEEELSKHFSLYIIDLPGCGRSDKPDIIYTSYFYVKLIRDFAEEIALESFSLAVSNSSATIALMIDVDAPGLVDGIVLVNPTAPELLGETPNCLSRLSCRFLNLPLLGPFIYNIYISKPRIDLAFSEQYLYNPFHDNDELVNAYFESAQLGEGKGNHFAASYTGRFLNMNMEKIGQKVKAPVRIIEGEDSPGAIEAISSWTRLNSEFDVTTIEHTRQLPHIEEPRQAARNIIDFLA